MMCTSLISDTSSMTSVHSIHNLTPIPLQSIIDHSSNGIFSVLSDNNSKYCGVGGWENLSATNGALKADTFSLDDSKSSNINVSSSAPDFQKLIQDFNNSQVPDNEVPHSGVGSIPFAKSSVMEASLSSFNCISVPLGESVEPCHDVASVPTSGGLNAISSFTNTSLETSSGPQLGELSHWDKDLALLSNNEGILQHEKVSQLSLSPNIITPASGPSRSDSGANALQNLLSPCLKSTATGIEGSTSSEPTIIPNVGFPPLFLNSVDVKQYDDTHFKGTRASDTLNVTPNSLSGLLDAQISPGSGKGNLSIVSNSNNQGILPPRPLSPSANLAHSAIGVPHSPLSRTSSNVSHNNGPSSLSPPSLLQVQAMNAKLNGRGTSRVAGKEDGSTVAPFSVMSNLQTLGTIKSFDQSQLALIHNHLNAMSLTSSSSMATIPSYKLMSSGPQDDSNSLFGSESGILPDSSLISTPSAANSMINSFSPSPLLRASGANGSGNIAFDAGEPMCASPNPDAGGASTCSFRSIESSSRGFSSVGSSRGNSFNNRSARIQQIQGQSQQPNQLKLYLNLMQEQQQQQQQQNQNQNSQQQQTLVSSSLSSAGMASPWGNSSPGTNVETSSLVGKDFSSGLLNVSGHANGQAAEAVATPSSNNNNAMGSSSFITSSAPSDYANLQKIVAELSNPNNGLGMERVLSRSVSNASQGNPLAGAESNQAALNANGPALTSLQQQLASLQLQQQQQQAGAWRPDAPNGQNPHLLSPHHASLQLQLQDPQQHSNQPAHPLDLHQMQQLQQLQQQLQQSGNMSFGSMFHQKSLNGMMPTVNQSMSNSSSFSTLAGSGGSGAFGSLIPSQPNNGSFTNLSNNPVMNAPLNSALMNSAANGNYNGMLRAMSSNANFPCGMVNSLDANSSSMFNGIRSPIQQNTGSPSAGGGSSSPFSNSPLPQSQRLLQQRALMNLSLQNDPHANHANMAAFALANGNGLNNGLNGSALNSLGGVTRTSNGGYSGLNPMLLNELLAQQNISQFQSPLGGGVSGGNSTVFPNNNDMNGLTMALNGMSMNTNMNMNGVNTLNSNAYNGLNAASTAVAAAQQQQLFSGYLVPSSQGLSTCAAADAPCPLFSTLPSPVQQKIVSITGNSHVVMLRDFDEKVLTKISMLTDKYGIDECLLMLDRIHEVLKGKAGRLANGPGYLDVSVSTRLDELKQRATGLISPAEDLARATLHRCVYAELRNVIAGASSTGLNWAHFDQAVIHVLKRLPNNVAVDRINHLVHIPCQGSVSEFKSFIIRVLSQPRVA